MSSITSLFPSLLSFDPVLAKSRIEAMNEAFLSKQSGTGGATGLVLVGIAALAIAVAALVVYLSSARSQRVINNPKKLFKELCRKHELSSSQKSLLGSLAVAKGLSDPCVLFIDANLWELDPAQHPKLCTARICERLRKTRHTLFNVAGSFPGV